MLICPQCQKATLKGEQRVCEECEKTLEQERQARRANHQRNLERLKDLARQTYAHI